MNEAVPYPPPAGGDDPARQLKTNAAQLKADHDSGRAGDKVAAGDPAASPLGTDEEAGGAPLSDEALSLARAQETHPDAASTRSDSRVDNARQGRPGGGVGMLLGVLAALVLVAVLAYALLGR
jgi:hypothetical protein